MHPVFSITIEQIQDLNDEVSRELVARLCKADLRTLGASQAYVTWGGDQRAKDGGVDVRVDIDPPISIRGYVRKDRTAFQVKAEKFSAGKIPTEMAPGGVIRPALIDLATTKGAYIIVSTRDNLSDKSLIARVKSMTDCLATSGLAGKVMVDFYDCKRLLDWISQHPAVALWIRHVLGTPIHGWRPYGGWAHKENDAINEYLLDDRAKVFLPDADRNTDVLTAIGDLRINLKESTSCRIVGLSGVGKTRLVQALFDRRISTSAPALDPENVLYTDLSDNPTPQPLAMIEALIAEKSDSVVVVDNCGPDVHRKLSELVDRAGSKLRLITIEYDIRDDLPVGTRCYRLDGSSAEVIKKLLKQRYAFLSQIDLDKISEFSDGNARVAFALASTTEKTGELARLRDEDLFNRLFHQQNSANGELLRCAEIASLLYSFEGEDTSLGSELQMLSTIAEVTPISFSRNIVELQRRGLVQTRAEWRAVLPHAIANRLAARAVESIPKKILIEGLIENSSDRVARSFSRRLGYLHELQIVRKIVADWLGPNGRFGNLAELSDIGQQIFVNLAPVHQEAALQALDRVSLEPNISILTTQHKEQYIRVARSLAYEPTLFEQAANILLRLALTEKDGDNSSSALNTLKSLFYCHLSGTEALPQQRAQFVHDLIAASDEARQSAGLSLLSAGLEAWNFSSHHEFDFGARKRGYGWWPKNREDVKNWFNGFISIAVKIAKSKSCPSQKVMAILAESLRGLWVSAQLEDEIQFALSALAVDSGWPDGWLGIRHILKYDKDRISDASLDRLQKIEKSMRPRNLRDRIHSKVLARGIFANDFDDSDGDHQCFSDLIRRAETEAEELGREATYDRDLLCALIPDLLNINPNSKIVSFGFGVGQGLTAPIIFLEELKKYMLVAATGHLNTSFIRGVILGMNKSNPSQAEDFLNAALTDDLWSKHFPELQIQLPLDDIAVGRLLRSIELNKAPYWQYRYLGFGRVTDLLTISQVQSLIFAISLIPDGGIITAIEVFAMVVHCANEKDEMYRKELATIGLALLTTLDWSEINKINERVDHDIEVIMDFTLSFPHTESAVNTALLNLIDHFELHSNRYSLRFGHHFSHFFKYWPKQALDGIYRKNDEDLTGEAWRRLADWGDDRGETAICKVPVDALIGWCNESPTDRFVFAARTCRLFERSEGESSTDIDISDAAIQVLSYAPDKAMVIEIFAERLSPRAWSGSLSAALSTRVQLLAKLNPLNDEEINLLLKKAETELRHKIQYWQGIEAADERKETGSFE